jgi:UDP-glucose 4-epimerase
MKVVVTGGAGFIGSHLVERLLKDKKIKSIVIIDYCKNGTRNIKHLLTNKRIKLVKLNIINLKKNNVNFKSIDCVFHLAAIADIVPSITDPINYYHTNVNGTLNVLEAMRFNKIKNIVYAASSSCYGIPKKFPTSESDKIDLRFPYSLTKYQGEQLIVHWSHVYNIRYVSLRLFNVYGLRSRTSGAYGAVMGVFLKQKIANKPLTIVGDGNQTRDFVNVVDVAEAFYKAFLLKKKNEIINIGSSLPIKINTLAKMISDNVGHIPKRPGEAKRSFANILKAKKILKWKPKIPLKIYIKDLINKATN